MMQTWNKNKSSQATKMSMLAYIFPVSIFSQEMELTVFPASTSKYAVT